MLQQTSSASADYSRIVAELSSVQQDILKRLIVEAVAEARRQDAATEVAHYALCFSQESSKDKAAQLRRIVKTASARLLCAQMACGALR